MGAIAQHALLAILRIITLGFVLTMLVVSAARVVRRGGAVS